MAITRTKKEETVSKFSDLFKKADLMIFVGFRGLSVAKVIELRRKLRAAGAHYMVAKKRLMRVVLKNEGIEIPPLEGEIGFVFGGEKLSAAAPDAALSAAKEVYAFTKAHKEAAVLGGVYENGAVEAHVIVRLAQIPPREVLLAQVLIVLQGPMRGFAAVLNGNQRKLAIALREIASTKK